MISFVIPAKNEADLIGRCLSTIDSAMRGAGFKYEVVVVDDCSTDDTVSRVRDVATVVQTSIPVSMGYTRNTGIDAAVGKHICMIDADIRLPLNFCGFLDQMIRASDKGSVVTGTLTNRNMDWIARCWFKKMRPPQYARGGIMFFKNDGLHRFRNGARSGEDYLFSKDYGWYRVWDMDVEHVRQPRTVKQFFKDERRHGRGSWDVIRLASFLFPISAPMLSYRNFRGMGPLARLQNVFLCHVYLIARLTSRI